MNINRRDRLWHGGIGFKGRNSIGVEAPRARIPRVAPPLFLGRVSLRRWRMVSIWVVLVVKGLSERAGSQPWALLRNPFGIRRDLVFVRHVDHVTAAQPKIGRISLLATIHDPFARFAGGRLVAFELQAREVRRGEKQFGSVERRLNHE